MKEAIAALAASALPTLMVLVGILLNRNDINRLDGRISALEVSLRGEIAAFRSQVHDDLKMVHGAGNEMDKRITRLEQKA